MNETPYQSPIPTPDGNLLQNPQVPLGPVSWKDAPLVVRGWAFPLMWLFGFVIAFVGIATALSDDPVSEKAGGFIFCILALAFAVWHARGLKNRSQAAWTTQKLLSCGFLFAFPIGTLIHLYILSQWSKPSVRAWFGK